jgi:hypothetical protein
MTAPARRRRPSRSSAHRRLSSAHRGLRWQRLLVPLVVLLGIGRSASPAGADPAGPTDYRSEVVAVEPAVPGMQLRVVGGDAFLELTAPTGVEVIVAGYQGEPYLRFAPDGTVSENRRSPTTYLNEDRYGGGAAPPDASPDDPPAWREVAGDGRYAWHDHRIHWMLPQAPPGLGSGDQVVDGEVRLQVDGRDVEVRVISRWFAPPSSLPLVTGAVAGLAVTVVARRAGGHRAMPWLALAAGAAAAGVAAAAHWSVPPETGPPISLLGLPMVAAVLAGVALLVGRWRAAIVLAAGAELVLWAVLRRDWLTAAVLPTDAPFWLDRSVAVAVAVAGVALVALAVRDGALGPLELMARPARHPQPPGPPPARS